MNIPVKDLELKVIKVKQIYAPASYVLIYPDKYSDYLSYNILIDKISSKLDSLGFNRVKTYDEAKYVFKVTFDFLNINKFPNNTDSIMYSNLFSKQTIVNTELDRILKWSNSKNFIFEAYIIHDDKYQKVFEGFTSQINYSTTLKALDKGFLGFVMCSIDALFDNKVNNNLEYQEYYYQCL